MGKRDFFEEEKINKNDVNQNVVTEDIKPVFIEDEKIITESDMQNNGVNKADNTLTDNKPVVLTVDDIKAKLDKLANKNNDDSNTLDNLLKQIGMEDNNISSFKDEEAILLGK